MIPSCLSLGICELIVSEPIVVLQRQESEHIKEKIIMASSVSPKEEHVAESASVSASAAASAAASSASVTESDSVATSASPPQNPRFLFR